jgi:D-amino-acid dehydrogenase
VRVTVLGCGVIGVTSAYYLAKAGHEVTVLERRPSPAMETSFANAGEISPGYASPWAAPGLMRKAVQWLLMEHSPLVLRPKLDLEMFKWVAALLRNCTMARYAINKERMVRLAEFSRDRLISLRAQTGIAYDQRARGTLQLFRAQKQLDGVGKDLDVLRAGGVPFELLDRARCVAIEPGLSAVAEKIAGGLHLPKDETGDCFKFTVELTALAAAMGVKFQFNTRVDDLRLENHRVVAATTGNGEYRADAFVLALGSYSARMIRPLGLRLPVYPVKGYSITLPIVNESRAPESTLMDETYKVAITRLGNRIRVGGTAEISGFNDDLRQKQRHTLEHSVEGLFPGAGDIAASTFWSGLRPMTPDGTPIIGPTPIRNLYTNTGHGTLGWTMACGSGHVLADVISGKPPAIDASDLSIARYGK